MNIVRYGGSFGFAAEIVLLITMTFTAKARNVSMVPFLYDYLPEELAIILITRQGTGRG